MASQLLVFCLLVLFAVVHWREAAVAQRQPGAVNPGGLPFDPTNPEDVAKLARDNISQVPQVSHVAPQLEPVQGELRDTCIPGDVHVFTGLLQYHNGNDYNERAQRCDWLAGNKAKCDPIFKTEFQYENPKGNTRRVHLRHGHYQDSTTVSFAYDQASIQVCAAPNTYVRIYLNVYDDDVTTEKEKIGSWDFQFGAVLGQGEHTSTKHSQRSNAQVKVFFRS